MRKNNGSQQSSCGRNKSKKEGFILSIALIIISAVLSIILLAASRIGLIALDTGQTHLDGVSARAMVDGCAEEAVLNLKRDPAYSGGVVTSTGFSCTISVVENGDERDVVVTGSKNSATQELQINLDVSPFQINSWDL